MKEKFDIYEKITERIIGELEKGFIPWQKPWTGTRSGAYSHATGKAYSLLNQMLLPPGEYITFKQAQAEGGRIKKGEKGHMVIFWKQIPVKEENKDGIEIEKIVPMLRYYTVFEVSQCIGIDYRYKEDREEAAADFSPSETAEKIASGYLSQNPSLGIIHRKQDEAFYSPCCDEIALPLKEQFIDEHSYYSTLFHEMVHSTGHESRLDRLNKMAAFGSQEYSKEELIAEIGAAALINIAGIETEKVFKNSTSYIQGWLRTLKNDKKLIVTATGKAQKAIDYILSPKI